jgi:hypothetical protein
MRDENHSSKRPRRDPASAQARLEPRETRGCWLHFKLNSLFPGLRELEAAIDDFERYQRDFQRMMDDESNDGARPPRGPRGNVAELSAKYPAAATYLRAQELATGSHWGSGRGPIFERAVERMEISEAATENEKPGNLVYRGRVTLRGKRRRVECDVSLSRRSEGELPQLVRVRFK